MVKSEGGDVQDVTGLDNQAPAGPDSTGSHQGTVLGKGELLSRAVEVRDTGDDQSPLHKEITSVIDLAKTSPSQDICIWSRNQANIISSGGTSAYRGRVNGVIIVLSSQGPYQTSKLAERFISNNQAENQGQLITRSAQSSHQQGCSTCAGRCSDAPRRRPRSSGNGNPGRPAGGRDQWHCGKQSECC